MCVRSYEKPQFERPLAEKKVNEAANLANKIEKLKEGFELALKGIKDAI
jgi:hypothetical protein